MAYTSPPSSQYTLIEPFSERNSSTVCQIDVIPWMPPLNIEDDETINDGLGKPLLSYTYGGLFVDTTTFADIELLPTAQDSTTLNISSGRCLLKNVYYELNSFDIDVTDPNNYLDATSYGELGELIGTFSIILLLDPVNENSDIHYYLLPIELLYPLFLSDPIEAYTNIICIGYFDTTGELYGNIDEVYAYDVNFPLTNRRVYPISPIINPGLNGGVIIDKNGTWEEDWS